MSVLIIAEAGVNHNGEPELACRLVDAAAAAGADLVKFQTFNATRLVTRQGTKAEYQIATTGAEESQQQMLAKLELSADVHRMLVARCRQRGIGFLSTAFDLPSLELLSTLDMPCYKVPSGEITNLPYLRRIGALGKPILLSTGMASLSDIEAALNVLLAAGAAREAITVLHCNTQYPTPMQDVNLQAMQAIRAAFGVAIGYSDHTNGIEIPIAAVALGARAIEKHLTLDRNLPGPDHRASLEPAEFTAMVTAIRNIEQALGDGRKRPMPSELGNVAIARKSIVAAVAIRRGERFDQHNLTTKRPGSGVSPMRWDEVIGRVATRDYAPDEMIEL